MPFIAKAPDLTGPASDPEAKSWQGTETERTALSGI